MMMVGEVFNISLKKIANPALCIERYFIVSYYYSTSPCNENDKKN